jgi:hypothetical protein
MLRFRFEDRTSADMKVEVTAFSTWVPHKDKGDTQYSSDGYRVLERHGAVADPY